MTQAEQILAHLKAGKAIDPLTSLRQFGCMRLGARIHELKREGHPITSVRVKDKRSGKTYASYRLAGRAR